MTLDLSKISTLLTIAALVIGIAVLLALGFRKLDRAPETSWDKWYARIDKFPSTKALIIAALGFFFLTGLVVAGNAMYFALTNKVPTAIFVSALDTWLDKVLILSSIGTVHFIGKRATTNAELEKSKDEAPAASS